MNLQKTILSILTCLIFLSLGACSTQPGAADGLTGSEWTLVSIGKAGEEQPAASGAPVTLKFDAQSQASGSGGCNSYGGRYQVDGNKITFSDIASTLMACADPVPMQQETLYFNALQSAESFELAGDSLVIIYDGGQGSANFARSRK